MLLGSRSFRYLSVIAPLYARNLFWSALRRGVIFRRSSTWLKVKDPFCWFNDGEGVLYDQD